MLVIKKKAVKLFDKNFSTDKITYTKIKSDKNEMMIVIEIQIGYNTNKDFVVLNYVFIFLWFKLLLRKVLLK